MGHTEHRRAPVTFAAPLPLQTQNAALSLTQLNRPLAPAAPSAVLSPVALRPLAPILSPADTRSLLAPDGIISAPVIHAHCQLLSAADVGFAWFPPSTLILQQGVPTWATVEAFKFTLPHTIMHPSLVHGHWWIMVRWPFFDEYLLYFPGTAEAGPASATIHKATVTKTIELFQKYGLGDAPKPWTGQFMNGAASRADSGILCLALAHVATESRVPIKGITWKALPAMIRKRFLSEIMRGRLEGEFTQYAIGTLRY